MRPPGRTGAEAHRQLAPELGRPSWRPWTTPRETQKSLCSDREWDWKQSRPKGWLHREESAQKGKRNRPNLRSDRGHTSLDLAGVTPSRRLRTIWEKGTHSNLYIQRKLESKGQEDGNEPRGQTQGGRTTTGLQVNIPKIHSTAADEARRRQPTVKEQRQARQECSHQPQEVPTIRRMTYEYDNSTLKKDGHIGKEQSPM